MVVWIVEALAATLIFLAGSVPSARASAADGVHAPAAGEERSVLPAGSNLDEDTLTNPREVFHSEALRGRRSYMSNLGNLAFNSPNTLGEVAQKARVSCATCHVNGASNPKLFIPGLSTRPGNFDTSSALFNPKTDNGVLDPVTIPSLRGARFLGPYGHDGRSASLRDFVRNVVVNEFSGAEPSSQLLDALVVYIEDIDFLPNPNLDKTGNLASNADASQKRGEQLFRKPFPHDPGMSCAGCHMPSAAFVDHQQHDIGSGGRYKTPTLLNADFDAPYFHDGRFDNYSQVIDFFSRTYDLGLNAQDRADLETYLTAIGDGVRPDYHLTGTNVLADINGFAGVLDIAISTHDAEVIAFTVRSVNALLQDLTDHYSDSSDHQVAGGTRERTLARAAIASLLQILQRVGLDAAAGRYSDAAADYLNYRKLSLATAPAALQAAEPWSSFTPAIRDARRASMQSSR